MGHPISDVRTGDIVVIRGGAAGGGDLSFQVTKLHRYVTDDDAWFEVEGGSAEGQLALEWWEDDELLFGLVRPADRLALDATGLTEDDLVRMDENPDEDHGLHLRGMDYRFEESYETGWGAGRGEPTAGFYAWDFEAVDGESLVGIEKWEDEDFQVFVAEYLDPEEVEVLSSR